MRAEPRIAFSWHGLPDYAAREIRTAIATIGRDCVVVGSRAAVPVVGQEQVLGCRIDWVDARRPVTWRGLGQLVPDVFVQSGWGYAAFNALGDEVRAHGGRVIGLSDANWRGDLRQRVLGRVAFRALHRRRFDAMIVPGRQGVRLMAAFGMDERFVRMGMLGADGAVFGGGPPLASRGKTMLFVGQFIARKDVLGLARAFIRFSDRLPEWSLRIVGSGAQRNLIPAHPRIVVEDFMQAEDLAERYHEARFLVLQSRAEAWGVVVHEAALAGCGLVLSDRIGSGDDLASGANCVQFRAGDEDQLVAALQAAAAFDDDRLARAEAQSRGLAAAFGPVRFAREVCDLVAGFTDRDRA